MRLLGVDLINITIVHLITVKPYNRKTLQP